MNHLYEDQLKWYARTSQFASDNTTNKQAQADANQLADQLLGFLLFFGLERVLNTPADTLERLRRVIGNSDDLDADEREELWVFLQEVANLLRHDDVVRAIGRP